MRTLTLSVLLLATLATGCKKEDPYQFETHLSKIKDAGSRATGFSGLEGLTKTVVSAPDNKDRIAEFGTKVIPVLEEVWDDATEQHEVILRILLDAGHPGGAKLWAKAVPCDGSDSGKKMTFLALEGIKKAKATGAAGAIRDELSKYLKNPKSDGGDKEDGGKLRYELAEALGALRDRDSVDLLIEVLAQTEKQPAAVYRAAASALGSIADPKAIDALVLAPFRIKDAMSTTNLGNRAKLALVAIGDPAVETLGRALRGEHADANKLAEANGADVMAVKTVAADILGAIGGPAATKQLLGVFPKADCTDPAASTDATEGGFRAVLATALGVGGDESAVETLCTCATKSKNPGDMWPIAQALGQIGGTKAAACLLNVIKVAEYEEDAVASPEFVHELRWEGARFAVLAASPGEMVKVKEVLSAADAKVREKTQPWQVGVALTEKCGDKRDCYLGVLKDIGADWFEREKAAYELARLAKGDKGIAVEISKAFKVRSPDARISMAILPGRVLAGGKCQECADELDKVIEGEKGTMDAKMQAAVLTARASIARLQDGAAAGTASGGDAAPSAAAPAPATPTPAPAPAKAG